MVLIKICVASGDMVNKYLVLSRDLIVCCVFWPANRVPTGLNNILSLHILLSQEEKRSFPLFGITGMHPQSINAIEEKKVNAIKITHKEGTKC